MKLIENENIVEYFLLKYNRLKHSAYIFLMIISCGLLYIASVWFPKLKYQFYDEVDSVSQADYLLFLRPLGDYSLSQVYQRKVKVLPRRPKKLLRYIVFDFQIFYFSEKKQIFIHIENKIKDFFLKQKDNLLTFNEGLNEEEVNELREFYGKNIISIQVGSIYSYILEQIMAPLILFQLLGVIVYLLSPFFYYGVIDGIFILVTVIYVSVEKKKALEKIRQIAHKEGRVKLKRKIKEVTEIVEVSSDEMVIGDCFIIEQDTEIYADIVITNGSCLVKEALLTGESAPVIKSKIKLTDEKFEIAKKNIVYCGSDNLVNKSFEMECVVYQTGWNTFKGDLLSAIIKRKPEEFKFKKDVKTLIYSMFLLGSILLTYMVYFNLSHNRFSWNLFLVDIFGVLMTLVPPALIFTFTVGLEASNQRLKEKGVITINVEKINEAGRVKYICFDKTGTLTYNSVKFAGFLSASQMKENGLYSETLQIQQTSLEVFEIFACCNSLSFLNGKIIGDPLDEEIHAQSQYIFKEVISDKQLVRIFTPNKEINEFFHLPDDYSLKVKHIFDFSSDRKLMSVVCQRSNGTYKLFCKGAPEKIKSLCESSSIPPTYRDTLDDFSERGFRIIAIASRDLEVDEASSMSSSFLEKKMTFHGFVLMKNPLKPETAETISILKEVDIECLMITGDNIHTAINIAYSSNLLSIKESLLVGIYNESSKDYKFVYYSAKDFLRKNMVKIGASDIQSMNDQIGESKSVINIKNESLSHILDICEKRGNIRIAVEGEVYACLISEFLDKDKAFIKKFFKYAVIFARTSPQHKGDIVQTLKTLSNERDEKYCVAFVGDGANDVKALKQANVSLSLGSNESSIAAPFHSSIENISPILPILIEGKSVLELSLQNFKFFIMSCLVEFSASMFLEFNFYILTDFDWVLFDEIIKVVLSVCMAGTLPANKLNKLYPRVSLFSKEVASSLIVFTTVALFTLVILLIMVINSLVYKGSFEAIDFVVHLNMNGHQFLLNKLFSLIIVSFMFVFFLSFNRGYPFRQWIFTNLSLVISFISGIILLILFIFANEIKLYYFNYFMVKVASHPHISFELEVKLVLLMIVSHGLLFFFEKSKDNFFIAKRLSGREVKALTGKSETSSVMTNSQYLIRNN